jgi:hypothetical protein
MCEKDSSALRRSKFWLRTLAVPIVLASLTACGTFNLGQVHSPPGRTRDQLQSDTLYCKDQASLAVSTAGRQTQDFLLGLTIVGAPIAYERDKDKQRSVFATCMQAKGYTVDSATDGGAANGSGAPTRTATSFATPAPEPVTAAVNVTLDLPAGFEAKQLTDEQRRVGAVAMSVNRAADVGVTLWVENHAGVADVLALAKSRRGIQMSRLQDPIPSEVSTIQVGGRNAYRWEMGGTINGIHGVYVVTIIEGPEELVTVSAWTSAANYQSQSKLMHELAGLVKGIR